MTNFELALLFGFAPSIIWLLFYLRKDHHPEPNRMVIKIFLMGMTVAIIAAVLIELFFAYIIESSTGIANPDNYPIIILIIYNVFGIALVEELAKFYIVKFGAMNNPAFDEPVDVMLYMIISALGFAALENLLVMVSIASQGITGQIPSFLANIQIIFTGNARFWGATFLHALASGLFGYFIALSICQSKKINRTMLFILGLALATLSHGIYNISLILISKIENDSFYFLILLPFAFLIVLAFIVSALFRHIKKIASTCQIQTPSR